MPLLFNVASDLSGSTLDGKVQVLLKGPQKISFFVNSASSIGSTLSPEIVTMLSTIEISRSSCFTPARTVRITNSLLVSYMSIGSFPSS